MTYSPYLPEGCEGILTAAQLRFIEFSVGLQARLLKKGKPVIKDRARFCEQMIELAKEYQWQQRKHAERDDGQVKFASLSNLARKFCASLAALEPATVKILDDGLRAHHACSGASEEESCSNDWAHGPERVAQFAAALADLEMAAADLSRRARLGRAEMDAEHWAAREFVRIYHASGWAPLKMSNSGREVKGATRSKLPEVVRCPAAVFEMAGIEGRQAEGRAMTTLRKLRKSSVPHPVQWAGGLDGEYDEVEWYQISLQKVEGEAWKDLPNFIRGPSSRRLRRRSGTRDAGIKACFFPINARDFSL